MSDIVNIILIVLLLINIFKDDKRIKEYKAFCEDARKIKSDNREMIKDYKLLTVYTKHVNSRNRDLRGRLAEIEEAE